MQASDLKQLDTRGIWLLGNDRLKYFYDIDFKEYGVVDILGYCHSEKYPSYVVFHVCEKDINLSEYSKALSVCRGLQLLAKEVNVSFLELILIGQSVNTSDSLCYEPDIHVSVKFYTYEVSLSEGLKFKESSGYKLAKSPLFDKLQFDPETIIKQPKKNKTNAK